MRRLAALFALLMALVSTAAWAQLPARPEGPIADYANVLTAADKATLDARLRDYNQATGRAIIVATVPSLDGEEIEPYAHVAVAKVLAEFSKDNAALKIKAGAMSGKLMSLDQVQALAKLPSREQLLATLVGTMQAPIVKFVRTLNEVPGKFVRTLAAVRDAKQKSAA